MSQAKTTTLDPDKSAAPLPLSVAIITFNEEVNIARTLAAVAGFAAEIVVVDSGSQDRTPLIAAEFGARVVHNEWPGHIAQKNRALAECRQEWILSLDADEVVSPELADEIRETLRRGDAAAYRINRRTHYLGRFLRYSWQPDRKLRLVRRAARPEWGGYNPHDVLRVEGEVKDLRAELYHYSYRDIEDHLLRTVRYARISARSYHRMGRRFSFLQLCLKPPLAFIKKLVLKGGWRDGFRGWIVAFSALLSVGMKYVFLWEIEYREYNNKSR